MPARRDKRPAIFRQAAGQPSRPTIMRILLPAVRGEIRLGELRGDRHGASSDVPITALFGQEDRTGERQDMTGWSGFSTRGCEFVEVPGDHFFLRADPPLLRDIVNSQLAEAQWST